MAVLKVDDQGLPYISDVWDFENFRELADDYELEVTDEQLERAMKTVVKNYNPTYGITWDHLLEAIRYVVRLDKEKVAS